MKNCLRAFLCATALLWTGTISAQNALPNSGFETWQTRPLSNERPEGWITSDDLIYQLLYPTLGILTPNATRLVTKSTSTHTGSFAAQLVPKRISIVSLGSKDVPSVLLLGDRFRVTLPELLGDPANLLDISRSRGIPYTSRPTQMSFWYKFTGTSVDQTQAGLVLTKGNVKTDGIVIGTADATLEVGGTTYKQFSLPITYTSTEAPDSLRLGFVVGGNQVFSSSAVFSVDDITFSTLATATTNPALAAALAVYPNPGANGVFSLASLTKPSVATAPLSVTDAAGRVVFKQKAAPASAANGRVLDLHSLSAGVYTLRLDTPEGVVARKLVIQ